MPVAWQSYWGWARQLLGVSCRSWQGIWGWPMVPSLHFFETAGMGMSQICWKVITRLVLTPGTEGLIHAWCIRKTHEAGDKGQRSSQASQQAENLILESGCCPHPPLATVLHRSGTGMLIPIPAPASVMTCRQRWLKGSHTCETVPAGKKPDSTHAYKCAFRRKAWLWPNAKTRLAKTRQVMISAQQQIIVSIKNYRLSYFTPLVIIQ